MEFDEFVPTTNTCQRESYLRQWTPYSQMKLPDGSSGLPAGRSGFATLVEQFAADAGEAATAVSETPTSVATNSLTRSFLDRRGRFPASSAIWTVCEKRFTMNPPSSSRSVHLRSSVGV